MPFPFKDLSNQYISLSYQDIVQRYNPGGSASYYLDGLGNELFTIPTTYVGQQVLTVGQSASYSIISLESISSSYVLTSEFSDSSSLSIFSEFSNTSSLALSSISSSHSQTASYALNAGTPITTGSTYPITASWSAQSVSASIASGINFVPPTSISASWASSSIQTNSSSYALTASYAITASYEIEIEFSSSWASQSLSSSHALNADSAYAISFVPQTATSASVASSSISASYAPIDPSYSASVAIVKQDTLVSGNTYPITSSSSISSSYSSTSSFSLTSSYINGFIFNNTSSLIVTSQSNVVVSQQNTGSYTSVFVDYAVSSGSNSRAGNIIGNWNGSNITYTEQSTIDIGNTILVTMSIDLSASLIRIISNVPSESWLVKTNSRYL